MPNLDFQLRFPYFSLLSSCFVHICNFKKHNLHIYVVKFLHSNWSIISKQNLQLNNFIGYGAYSEVYKVIRNSD